jgi:hypothetical protein
MTALGRPCVLMQAAALVASLILSQCGFAQQPASEPQPTMQDLMRQLQERDSLILDLRRRVEALERQTARTADPAQPGRQPAAPPAPAALSAEQKAPTPTAPAAARASGAAAAAPGQFEVDEEAAERALERALVVTGALLLPVGQADIQASLAYIRSEQDAPGVFLAPEGQLIASQQVRRDTFSSALFMRFGLPFESQLEVGIPYRYVDQQVVTTVGFGARAETESHGSGFGDVSLGLAKGLLHERRWWPDLIGRVTWDTDSGKRSDGNVALGGGFNELQGSLTMTKRQDPLVFLGSASYATTFEEDDVKPGDALGFSVGALLAASPETSLRVILNQTFVNELQIGDRTISGSDQVIGTLSLGASSIIGRGKFLDITAGVGLTDAAPDYSIGASLSIRFDVPVLR